MYTKFLCPYCSRARALLQERGAHITEYDITLGGPKRREMLQRANGRMTVPQIFIDDRHIGGCDDLVALDRAGGLAPLLG
jgi:glutaredoxin 3